MEKGFEFLSIQPFEDKRGSLKKIVMKSQLHENEHIEEVYVLYSEKESVRGNHYHKKTIEFFTVVSGIAKVALQNLTTGEKEERSISASDNLVMKVPPYVVHGFKNEGDQPLIILALSSKEYNRLDTDTFAVNILE
ncbi:WxcM-like domain-containing protein [Heliophilum fasciatum]|uniref:dTDP-4-dehydrorhamnose 3,5-epimerase n=1 Tax=Heliophilum fasciatum TaxID=35700 RepID=A0A4R2RB01_9FIRM|nr:WxcM-like domain-containing protein [Heliophilum fasciatum]MCW2279260.1 dTDP-4-dehydrorhamnose 3,5-epimerase [Heliophilum fasciatum]TCP60492.1 dTDP-4-dehydrorhamnose 3,5-epimerase [Heliophilum fasciatum]